MSEINKTEERAARGSDIGLNENVMMNLMEKLGYREIVTDEEGNIEIPVGEQGSVSHLFTSVCSAH